MSSILVDNWTLQRAAASISLSYDLNYLPNIEYARLVEAIVLWDEILYVDNEFSSVWKDILWRFGYTNYLKPLQKSKVNYDESCDYIIQQAKKYSEEFCDKQFENDEQRLLAKGAIEYNTIANSLKINYLPVKERADFLNSLNLLPEHFDRLDLMDYFDKEMLQYYSEINSLIGKKKFRYSFPALFDFVANNSTSGNYIATALQMRTEKEIKDFKWELNVLEDTINSHNKPKLEKALNQVSKTIKIIAKKMPNFTPSNSELIIKPFPIDFITLHTKLPKLRNRISLDFIRKLANFSIYYRPADDPNDLIIQR